MTVHVFPKDNASPADANTELEKYIARVQSQSGAIAQTMSFRKIAFRTWHETAEGSGAKYYAEKIRITLNADGTVRCSAPEYAPTEAEAAAIKPELIAAARSWPKWIPATLSGAETQRRREKVLKEHWFVCPDNARKNALWCQQRTETEFGRDYIPWTLWEDGEWRRMEPDGALPFWKPPEKREAAGIMLHEGAKAARYVDWLLHSSDLEAVEARRRHPWTESLERYEHWGVMGGALAPHRTNYNELREARPSEVVYVCDNDRPGETALQKVSQAYRGALFGIKFDNSWPPSWDMADPMPEKLFEPDRHTGQDRYVGKALEELMVPATWATDLVAVADSARRVAKLREEFKREWAHTVKPETFINSRWPARLYSTSEFNSRVRPFSDAADTMKLLLSDDAGKVESLTYDPGQRSGFVAGPPRAFNTFQPSCIRAVPGDCAPWLEYLERLITEPADRLELARWCATLIARPELRMLYGVLLISETQGVGKSTLGEQVLTPLLGEDNVSFPSESDLLESQFTEWKAHKRLVMIHEIYQGNSSRPYNKLKDLITDGYIRVNKKFQVAYQLKNWCHIMACSNSLRALKLPEGDRRWLVPAVTEELAPPEYWVRFNEWLKAGGLGAIKAWAPEWLKANGGPVPLGQHAPFSIAKRRMVREGHSPGQRCVADWLDAKKAEGAPVVTTDKALVELIQNEIWRGQPNPDKLERDATVRTLAQGCGWFVAKDQIRPPRELNLPLARLIATDERLAAQTPQQLAEEGVAVLFSVPWRGVAM